MAASGPHRTLFAVLLLRLPPCPPTAPGDLRWLPAAALAALAAGAFSREDPWWAAWLSAGSLAALHAAFSLWKHRRGALLALVALLMAGWMGTRQSEVDLPLGEPSRLRGRVVEDPRWSATGPRAAVEIDGMAPLAEGSWRPARGRVLLQVRGEPPIPLNRGDQVFFRSALAPAHGFRNPGGERYRRHLARKGISARAGAKWPGEVLAASPGAGTPLGLRLRRRASEALAAAVPGQAGAVLRSLALGDRSGLSPGTTEVFRKTGTTHLIAISGLHLGILALLLVPVFRALLVRMPALPRSHPVEPFARAAALPALVAYASLSGFQVSTVRALSLVGLLILGSALSQAPSAPLLLLSTLLVLALPAPGVLADPGLHLSAAALVGLFWLAPKVDRVLTPSRRPLDAVIPRPFPARVARQALAALRTVASASLATTLTTTPVAAFHFGTGSLLGLAANPLAVPVTGFLILPLCLGGTLLFHLCPLLARLAWSAAGLLVEALLAFLGRLASHAFGLGGPVFATLWSVIGCGFLLAAFGELLEPTRRWQRAALLAALGGALITLPPVTRAALDALDRRVHVWVFDVGQGQAVGVRLPGSRWILVDAGGFSGSTFDVGERLVVPALERLGARRLWLLVSTHPHPDHLGGMVAALRWGKAEHLWLPEGFRDDPRYGELLEEARRQGTAVRWVGDEGRVETQDRIRVTGVSLPGRLENDRSLVLRVAGRGGSFLLPGDLETAGQSRLLKAGFPIACDLLVAPHHASADALYPSFLEAARPKTVVASAGGRTGLPSSAFESAAAGLGATFLSTHRVGCVHAELGTTGLTVGAPFH